MAESLYFIAIIPPEPYYSEALEWKRFFAEQYSNKAALRSPPHVTLHMPFRWDSHKEKKLTEALYSFGKEHSGFELILKDFGAFEPRVIYIDVILNDGLRQLQKALSITMRQKFNVFNGDYKNKGYTPHLTLAFRDLRKGQFHKAWKEISLKTYNARFDVNHFVLLKHNQKFWEEYLRFDLK